MYVRELAVRYRLRRVRRVPCGHGIKLDGPVAAANVLCTILRSEIVEVCGVMCLSARHEVLAYHELSRGTLDHTMVHPRDVFRTALLAHASSVVVGHNHPSGDPTPSADDIAVTKRLKHAADIVGIDLLDHLIVTLTGKSYSFRESGHL